MKIKVRFFLLTCIGLKLILKVGALDCIRNFKNIFLTMVLWVLLKTDKGIKMDKYYSLVFNRSV